MAQFIAIRVGSQTRYASVQVLKSGQYFLSAPAGYMFAALMHLTPYERHNVSVQTEDDARALLRAGLGVCSLSPRCIRCDGYVAGKSIAATFRADEDWRAARRRGSKSWQLQRARTRAIKKQIA